MGTQKRIIEFFKQVGDRDIVATRDLVHLGPRGAVDNATSSLVKEGFIVRLAWGLFAKMHHDKRPFSFEEIAHAKARAFKRELHTMGSNVASTIGLPSLSQSQDESTFATNGATTQFRYLLGEVRYIKLRRHSARKLHFEDNKLGHIIRALWQIGKANFVERFIAKAIEHLSRIERAMLRACHRWIPIWIYQWYFDHRPVRGLLKAKPGQDPVDVVRDIYKKSTTSIPDIPEPEDPEWTDDEEDQGVIMDQQAMMQCLDDPTVDDPTVDDPTVDDPTVDDLPVDDLPLDDLTVHESVIAYAAYTYA